MRARARTHASARRSHNHHQIAMRDPSMTGTRQTQPSRFPFSRSYSEITSEITFLPLEVIHSPRFSPPPSPPSLPHSLALGTAIIRCDGLLRWRAPEIPLKTRTRSSSDLDEEDWSVQRERANPYKLVKNVLLIRRWNKCQVGRMRTDLAE
jgi:hypothetical protein